MELLDPFASSLLAPADRPPDGVPGRRECLLAGAAWLLAVAAAWLVARRSGLPAWDDFAFFAALTVTAAWLSASLPLGVHLARITTPVAVAAIALGAGQALVVSLTGGLLAIGGLVLLKRWLGVSQRSNQGLIVAGLWSSAATSLALLPACWLHTALRGDFASTLFSLGEFGRYALFATAYFLAWALMLALWLAMNGVGVRAYLDRSWRAILINGYLPLGFAPLIALAYETWPHLRLLILGLYAVGGLLTYSVNRAYLSIASRANELRALNRIGQALSASLDLDRLIEAIRLEIGGLLDVSGFYLALYDEQTQTVSFPITYESGEVVPIEPHVFANGVTEHVIRTRKPLLLTHDVSQQAERLGLEPQGRPPRSYVGVPILSGDRVIGMLGLRDYAREHAYRPSDVQLLETVASQAGAALRNAQLFQRSQRQASELAALHRISLKASSSLELHDVLRAICQEVVTTMGLSKIAIFLVDEETQTLNLVEGLGLSEWFRAGAVGIDVRESYRAEVVRTGEPLVVEDVLNHPLYRHLTHAAEEGILSLIDLPLRRAGRVIGVLTAYYPQPHVFTPHEIELMQTLAGQIAIAVENAQLFEATRARTRDLETLYEASTAINASLSLKNVLVAVGTSMLHALHTRSCLALIALEDRQTFRAELRLVAGEGDTILEDTSLRLSVRLGEMPNVGMAEELQRPVVLGPLSATLGEGERTLLDECGVQAALAVPLFVRGEMIGLIVTGSPDKDRMFPPDQMQLAEALANQAAVAIDNATLFEQTDVALKQRLDELASLEMISQRMTRRLDLTAVIEQVVLAGATATGAEFCEVALYDERAQLLRTAARRSTDTEEQLPAEWPASEGLTGRAIRSGAAVLVNDVSQDPDYVAARAGVRAELAVPIVLDGQRLGVINLESARSPAFNPDHVRFVTNLAEHAAIAIQNARLFEAVQRRAEEFNTLRTIAVDLLSSSDVKHTLQVIVRGALEHTHATNVHIYLYDQATDRLTFGTSLWESGEVDREFAPPRPTGLTATVARSGDRLVITNPRQHRLYRDLGPLMDWQQQALDMLEAIIGVPLKRGDEVIGVFTIAFSDQARVNEDTLRYLDFLAAQAAVAIASAELRDQTRTGRDLLQAILDSSHDGILMLDMDQRLVMANSRAEWLLNLRLTDYLNERMPAIVKKISRMASGQNILRSEGLHGMIRQTRDYPLAMTRRRYALHQPTTRTIEEITTPVIGHQGEMLGRMFILRDVTQEVELEAFRDEMSHMMVHDLRSPLGGVITGLYAALEEIQGGMDSTKPSPPDLSTVSTMLVVALSSAQSLLRLIEAILDVSRLEAGKMALELSPVDLAALAQRACEALDIQASQANIIITVDAPPDLPPVMADSGKIERVFQNLLDNAIRYTPHSGRVRVSVEASEGKQTVTVADTGEGVPLEDRERVFERFVQLDSARPWRGAKGSGLGLTFCKLAVEAHGGRIWVDDAPEGGAAFHFSLPAGPATE